MSTTAVGSASSPVATTATWRDVVTLLKLRIGVLVVITALVGAVAAGGREISSLCVLALACLAASSGASALNHWFDRDLDARMARTASRPLPSGRIRDPRVALALGLGLIAASTSSEAVIGWGAVAFLLAGSATYALVYTVWLKRRTPYSIAVGGAAGSFAALAGWQSVASTWDPAALLLAVVLLLWTRSHFWSLSIVLERDYRAARIPALSAIVGARRTAAAVHANTIALVASSLALGVLTGWVALAFAAAAGACFLAVTHRLWREPTTDRAWLTFKLSGLYLLVVLAGIVLPTPF